MIFEELANKREKFRALEKELSSPDLLSDREKYKQKAKEYAGLKELVQEYDKYFVLDFLRTLQMYVYHLST